MDSLFGDVAILLQHNPWLAVVAVFVGGVMTALNPCVLAMIPLLMSASRATAKRRPSSDRSSFPCFSSLAWP
jgi:cytochrome c biogenesis protein CcdA